MAADAEVKLNFTASIEQARAAIAEVSAAMEKLQATGGVMRPEDAALMNEMQGQLAAYKARVDELDAAYRALQASGGEANTAALEQIKELQQEVETLTKQQNALVDKVVSLQVENNKLKGGVQEVGKETEKAGDGGVKVVRSMRGVVANFIRDLARGKLAVRELGVALKGLAYSTVVLGAIQLAMDGIIWAWEGIKSMFTESKEEMQAAEEAAKRAQEELDKANKAAADAERKYKEFQEKIKNDESTARLKTQIEDIAAAYKKMRDEQEKIFGLAQLQAELENRKVQDKAEQEMHEITLQRLELKRKKLLGEISESGYDKAAARLDLREKGIKNQSEVDKANLRVRQLEGELQAIRKEFAELQIANHEEREAQAGRASSTALEGARLNLEKSISRRDAAFMEYKNTPYYGMNLPKFFTEKKNWQDARWHEFVTAKKNWQDAQKGVKIAQSLYDKIKEQNEGYEEGEERIKQQVKRIGELSARFDKVEAQLKTAKSTAREIEDKTFIKSLRENEIADAENAVRTAEAVARKRKEAKKPAKVSGELKEAVKQIVKDAKTAYNTDGDRTDDVEVMRAVAELLRNNGSEMGGYKDGLKELLTVCSMLKVKGDSNSAELARLKTEIKSLKRRTSQQ